MSAGGKISIIELAAFMAAAEVVGADCHWMVGAGALHQIIHWASAVGIGLWCFEIAKRAA